MNRYLKKWLIYNLYEQKYILTLMIVQLIIITFILSLFFSTSFAIRSDLNEMLQEQGDTIFSINIVPTDEFDFNRANFDLFEWGNSQIILNEYDNLPINQHTFQHLRQEFGDLAISLHVEVNLAVMTEYETQFLIFYDSTLENVQITTGFYELIRSGYQGNIINVRDLHFNLDGNKISTLDGLEFSVETAHYSSSIELEYIRLPIEAYYSFHHPRDVANTRLEVQIDANYISENFQEITYILQYLNNEYGRYFSYYLSSDFADFFTQIYRADNESSVFIAMSLILLIVISISMSASFVILLNRQKKEISVMMAIGVTKTQLCYLSIAQPVIISMLGTLLGMIPSVIILSIGFQVATITTYLNIFVILGVFIFLQCLAFLASLPMVLKIRKLMPIELLSSE